VLDDHTGLASACQLKFAFECQLEGVLECARMGTTQQRSRAVFDRAVTVSQLQAALSEAAAAAKTRDLLAHLKPLEVEER
jgi:hypothetical protein